MREVRGQIFTSKYCFMPGSVLFEKGKIVALNFYDEEKLTEVERHKYVIPGLVDIHFHGACGIDIGRACLDDSFAAHLKSEKEDDSFAALRKLVEFERQNGVTSLFPATMSLPVLQLQTICGNIAEASEKLPQIKGIYLEGPFLSAEKCGAQAKEHLLNPDIEVFERINCAAKDKIRFLGLAPELAFALDFIKSVSESKTVCLAHSTADYKTAEKAFLAGAKQVTHLYNAMEKGSPREPGIPAAAFDNDNVKVELIADGIHLHPSTVRAAFRLYGPERIILISDSTEATGMADGCYMLGDSPIRKTGRLATLIKEDDNESPEADSRRDITKQNTIVGSASELQQNTIAGSASELQQNTIAGSASTLYDCLLSAVAMGISLEDAVTSATATPAKAANIFDRVGSLEVGKDADFVIMNKDLEIEEVFCNEERKGI